VEGYPSSDGIAVTETAMLFGTACFVVGSGGGSTGLGTHLAGDLSFPDALGVATSLLVLADAETEDLEARMRGFGVAWLVDPDRDRATDDAVGIANADDEV